MQPSYQITSISKSLKGEIVLPASKSESNRALIIQKLTAKPFNIHNLSDADDTVILQQLLNSTDHVLHCGDGGTTFRFLLACLAFKGDDKIITGSERLCNRPVKPLVDALIQLGASISYLEKDDFPPLKIGKGDFSKANEITINADVSSQFISALLMIAPLLPGGLKISLAGKILSKPYLLLTLSMMNWFGIEYFFDGSMIEIKPQEYKANDFTIGADWSAASYFYEMAVLAGEADILLLGLSDQSAQGDKVVAQLMRQFGVTTLKENNGIRIIKKPPILPEKFEYDFSDCPDLAQTFVMTCAGLGVAGNFKGLNNLTIKETDRLKALQINLNHLGIWAIIKNDSIYFIASKPLLTTNQTFESFNDHRMVMSLAPLALRLKTINIDRIVDVSKSFPGFWGELLKLDLQAHLLY